MLRSEKNIKKCRYIGLIGLIVLENTKFIEIIDKCTVQYMVSNRKFRYDNGIKFQKVLVYRYTNIPIYRNYFRYTGILKIYMYTANIFDILIARYI